MYILHRSEKKKKKNCSNSKKGEGIFIMRRKAN